MLMYMKEKQGIVVKSVGGVFTVIDEQEQKYVCFAPKKLRFNDLDVIVGDRVSFEDIHRGKGVVTAVEPRRNKLARPEIANVDVCFILLAPEPQPDFYLCDKVLINCFQEHIEPIVVVNKSDLPSQTAQMASENYARVADVISVCAMDQSVNCLLDYLRGGKVGCFAGQSAVGKTSVLNALLPEVHGQTGDISAKSGRGVHTTRHSSLHKVADGYLVDTCGFSLCELQNVRSDELRLYLDDFVEIARQCKYTSCTHTVEPECAVREAVERGKLCKARYDRYVEEFNELKQIEEKRYQ